jgi:Protein of unknown function (DUF2934)
MPAGQSDEEAIARLAYQLWEARGCPAGTAEQDWLEAEAMLAASVALKAATDSIPTLHTAAALGTERRKSRANKSPAARPTRRPD